MPIYDFKCLGCGATSEVLLLDGDTAKAKCPECGSGEMERLLSTFNTARHAGAPPGRTCCGREERCEKPPCSQEDGCARG